MQGFAQLAAAAGFIGTGSAMALYEWSRIKAERPLLAGRNILVMYWVCYLTCFVLGVTFVFAAVLR